MKKNVTPQGVTYEIHGISVDLVNCGEYYRFEALSVDGLEPNGSVKIISDKQVIVWKGNTRSPVNIKVETCLRNASQIVAYVHVTRGYDTITYVFGPDGLVQFADNSIGGIKDLSQI